MGTEGMRMMMRKKQTYEEEEEEEDGRVGMKNAGGMA